MVFDCGNFIKFLIDWFISEKFCVHSFKAFFPQFFSLIFLEDFTVWYSKIRGVFSFFMIFPMKYLCIFFFIFDFQKILSFMTFIESCCSKNIVCEFLCMCAVKCLFLLYFFRNFVLIFFSFYAIWWKILGGHIKIYGMMKCCIFRWTAEWMEDGHTERWIKFAKQKSSFHLSIVLFDKSILRMINFNFTFRDFQKLF